MEVQYALCEALESVGVSGEKSRRVARALEQDMNEQLATKADLQQLSVRIDRMDGRIDQLRRDVEKDMALLGKTLTIRMGSMIGAATSLLFVALAWMR